MHGHEPACRRHDPDLHFGTLADNQSKNITLTSPTDAGDCKTIPNTAVVTATEDNAQGGDNDDDGQITVSCPDITVVKTGSGTIVAGATAEYTIDITNNGPGTANNVILNPPDTLPNGGLDWVLDSQGLNPHRHRRRRLHALGGATSSTARSRPWPSQATYRVKVTRSDERRPTAVST